MPSWLSNTLSPHKKTRRLKSCLKSLFWHLERRKVFDHKQTYPKRVREMKMNTCYMNVLRQFFGTRNNAYLAATASFLFIKRSFILCSWSTVPPSELNREGVDTLLPALPLDGIISSNQVSTSPVVVSISKSHCSENVACCEGLQ